MDNDLDEQSDIINGLDEQSDIINGLDEQSELNKRYENNK